jgi:hypothetical protein
MYFSFDWYDKNIATIPDKKTRQEKAIIFLTSVSDYLAEESYKLSLKLHEEAKETGDKGLLSFSLLNIYYYKKGQGLSQEALEHFKESEKLLMEAGDSLTAGIACQMIAFEYWASGMRDKAFELAYYGLKIARSENGEGIGWSNFQFGVFHFDMKEYDIALDYFQRSEKQAIELELNYQLARTRSGIGGIYIATNRLQESLQYNELALEGYRECGHQTAISRALNDLGVINFRLGNGEAAEKYLREALEIRERLSYAPGIITSQMELSRVLMSKKETTESESLLLAALQMSNETRSKQKIAQCHMLLSELYKQKLEPWKALEHLENYFTVKSEVTGEEANNKIKSLQQKFATEKADQETEIHRLKNVELKKAYMEIEEKNKSITDSIQYAKRIQQSLLPSEKYIEKSLTRLKKN